MPDNLEQVEAWPLQSSHGVLQTDPYLPSIQAPHRGSTKLGLHVQLPVDGLHLVPTLPISSQPHFSLQSKP